MELRIDPEFQSKIPPLTEAEFNQLEENILSDGEVRDPIVTWNGTIIDGHNRWKIIKNHPEIPYKVKEMDFTDKWDAFDWMIKKQLGQRNLTEEQRDYLIGKRYQAQKNTQSFKGNQYTSGGGQNVQNQTRREQRDGTAGRIGKEYGITDRTVRRDERFANGIDAIREYEPELADSILKSETKVSKRAIREIGLSEPGERAEIIQAVKEGRKVQTVQPKVEKPKMTDEEKQKRKEEIEQINEIRDRLFQQETKAEYTIESLLTDIENNARPYINLFRQMIERNKELCKTNKQVVINAIQDNVIAEMNDLVKEIEGYE